MVRIWIACLALVLSVMAVGGFISADSEAVAEIPAQVTDTVKKLAGDAKFEVEKKTSKKKTFYVAEWKSDDSEHEVLLDGDGKLLREEQGVKAEAVPAKVRESAAKLLGAEATIKWDKITIHAEGGAKVVYDADSGKKEITLNEAGILVDDDDDDEDEDDEDEDDDDEDDDDEDDDDD
ncbi:MAG: hypothetical protein K8I27_09890 [Planctomycetes bacterium]|nr:hypothetical protein [Planctomycetota bacterium]